MSTTVKFTKMHGLGNDFIVLDNRNDTLHLTPRIIQRLSNRHRGIGFDQCLLVESPKHPDSDFYYRIFNADGTEVSQCGNGARCLALFIKNNQLSQKLAYTVTTSSSTLQLKPLPNGEIWVAFDEPQFSPSQIPLIFKEQADYYPFSVGKKIYYLHCVNVGNPHGVLFLEALSDEIINHLGLALSQHPKFIQGANISFAKMHSKKHIELRVFERGAGETKACGSGAIATAACARLFHQAEKEMIVSLPGGELSIDWQGLGHKINFTGPAVSVFEGVFTL